MHIVKIRRVGNSNVISLPREYEAAGYTPGSSVAVDRMESGEVVLVPTPRLHRDLTVVMQRVVAENREALEKLAAYDRGDATVADG